MCTQECKNNCSLLLIKPEATRAGLDTVIKQDLRETGLVVCELTSIHFTHETAASFWHDLQGRFTWADEYYEHMTSGPCSGVVVRGVESGVQLKKAIRKKHSLAINCLQNQLGTSFSPDVIHGSDPGDHIRELGIVCKLIQE